MPPHRDEKGHQPQVVWGHNVLESQASVLIVPDLSQNKAKRKATPRCNHSYLAYGLYTMQNAFCLWNRGCCQKQTLVMGPGQKEKHDDKHHQQCILNLKCLLFITWSRLILVSAEVGMKPHPANSKWQITDQCHSEDCVFKFPHGGWKWNGTCSGSQLSSSGIILLQNSLSASNSGGNLNGSF